MKKLLGILLSVVTVACACFVLTGCTSGYTYARADEYSVGETELASSDVNSIDIDWVSGEVKVVHSDVDKITITESAICGDITSDFTMRYLLENGTLRIKFAKSGKWRFGNLEKALTVSLPTATELDELDVDTASADFDADKLVCNNVGIDTASGDISIGGGRVNKLNLDVASGDIDVRLESADSVEADTASGDVNLVLQSAPTSVNVDTASGDVSIAFPESVGFSLEYDTASGDFDTEFSVSKNKDVYTCGDGAVKINVDTASGDLEVRKIA